MSDSKTDVAKVEQGAWVDKIPEMEGLRLKVRGINNKDWRKLQQRMFSAVPRKKRQNSSEKPAKEDVVDDLFG